MTESPGNTKLPSAWAVLQDSAARAPGGKWLFGPVALGAAGAVVLGLFGGSFRSAVFGLFAAFVVLVLYYAFVKGAAGIKTLVGPLTVLVWAVTLIFVVMLVVLCSCTFLGKPLDLRHWIDERAATGTAR